MPNLAVYPLRRVMFPVFFSLFVGSAIAQKITGTITDASGEIQDYATVTLHTAQDSAFVKGAVTDERGRFELENAAPGAYFVRGQRLGFRPTDSEKFNFVNSDITLPTLVLAPLSKELQEVMVVAQKPLIEVQADKLVFNVDASPTNTGLNALELLRKSPGVSLDQNDNISLKGRQNVMVQINGKLTPMTGQDLAQFLRSLSSNDIEAIEIIATPGAKYDAEGNAGIINLRLKKDTRLGTNGSVNLGFYQGITTKGDASININHRDRKVNLFGSASIFRGRWDNTMNLDNRVGDRRFNQRNNSYWFARPARGSIGMDYSPNSRHTFGMLVTGGYFVPNNWQHARTEIGSLAQNRVDSLLIAQNEGSMLNWTSTFNLNYKFADTLGNTLNVDADYGIYRDSNTVLNRNFYRDPENVNTFASSAFRMNMPRDIDIRSVKADYERTLQVFGKPKDSKIGAGAKLSDVATDNTFNFFNVANGVENFDTDRSNTFEYRERIAAGYLNGSTKLGKFSLQAGLRAEHTDIRGDLIAYKPVNNQTVDTAYLALFPSAAIGYALNDNHQINLTYRRSIDRPRYQDLNPFEFRIDELSYRRGNPFMRPQFTHTVELGWTLFQRINISANYAQTRYAFANITDQEIDPMTGKQRFFIQVRNLATRDNIGFSLNTPMPIAKWWNGNLNFWYNHSINKADYGDGRTIDLRVGGGGFWTQQTFTLTPTLSAEVSGWYNWGGLWGAYVNRPQGVMDVGFTKRLWEGSGTLRVSFTDVWHTAQWSSFTEIGNLYIDASGTWEGQQFKVNMTYRFGGKNIQNARRRTTAADEESKRASGDGGNGGGGGGGNK
ncbi:MAG: TonB-dependent receptor [Saprospiraceae bacterium]|jgi:iron complex outermembrane receptor protein|nr:TonB-dependent receptor [Saprospiraceae bacterium]